MADEKDKPITHQAVESSNVASAGYCPDRKCIEVCFKNGGTYRYHDSTQEEFDALLKAKSIGSHLHTNLKAKKTTKH